MKRLIISTAIALALAGCATSSGVMERADGAFEISASAAPMRGGATGARAYAFEQAQAYCQKTGQRAVLLERPQDETIVGQVGTYGASGNAYANAYSGSGQYRASGFNAPMVAGSSSITFACK